MGPFRDYQQALSAVAQAQLRQHFYAIVRQVWSPAEIEVLTRAARAALL